MSRSSDFRAESLKRSIPDLLPKLNPVSVCRSPFTHLLGGAMVAQVEAAVRERFGDLLTVHEDGGYITISYRVRPIGVVTALSDPDPAHLNLVVKMLEYRYLGAAD